MDEQNLRGWERLRGPGRSHSHGGAAQGRPGHPGGEVQAVGPAGVHWGARSGDRAGQGRVTPSVLWDQGTPQALLGSLRWGTRPGLPSVLLECCFRQPRSTVSPSPEWMGEGGPGEEGESTGRWGRRLGAMEECLG